MGNEKKIRLIRAAKEFNVGLNTITDFLHRKGIEIDSSPNTPIDADTYAILEKEYGKNRPSGSELDSVREKMNKKTTVSIEPAPAPQPKEEKKEEKRTIEVKDEVVQPKILGKIDLSPKKKAEPVPAPKAEPKQEVKVEAPKVEPQPKAEPAPAPQPKAEPVKVEEPKKEEPKKVAPKASAPKKPSAKKAPAAPKKSLEKEPELSPVTTAKKVTKKPAQTQKEEAKSYINLGGTDLPYYLL